MFATSHGTTLRPPRFKDLTTGNTYEPNKGGGGVIWWPQRQMAGLSGWHMGLVLMRHICTQCVFRRSRPHLPVLDHRIQWLWQTTADQVGAKRRAVWDHVPWSMARVGRCSTFVIYSPFRRILCES